MKWKTKTQRRTMCNWSHSHVQKVRHLTHKHGVFCCKTLPFILLNFCNFDIFLTRFKFPVCHWSKLTLRWSCKGRVRLKRSEVVEEKLQEEGKEERERKINVNLQQNQYFVKNNTLKSNYLSCSMLWTNCSSDQWWRFIYVVLDWWVLFSNSFSAYVDTESEQ